MLVKSRQYSSGKKMAMSVGILLVWEASLDLGGMLVILCITPSHWGETFGRAFESTSGWGQAVRSRQIALYVWCRDHSCSELKTRGERGVSTHVLQHVRSIVNSNALAHVGMLACMCGA